MGVPLLAHPFRLQPDGSIATHDDTDEAYYAERLAIIITTIPGERDLVPDFGINDPAFEGLSESALALQVETFLLPIEIVSVERVIVNDSSSDYLVQFNTLADPVTEDGDEEDV